MLWGGDTEGLLGSLLRYQPTTEHTQSPSKQQDNANNTHGFGELRSTGRPTTKTILDRFCIYLSVDDDTYRIHEKAEEKYRAQLSSI